MRRYQNLKKILLILCMLVLFLTACGSDQAEVESEEFNLETDFQSEYYDWTTEPHPIVEVENGYYMLVGYYLYYVDKETMEYTPLCNKPNCLHQEETDQMKVMDCNAMVRLDRLICTNLNYYKQHLYIAAIELLARSEERRVGKESKTGLAREHENERGEETADIDEET